MSERILREGEKESESGLVLAFPTQTYTQYEFNNFQIQILAIFHSLSPGFFFGRERREREERATGKLEGWKLRG